MRGLLLCSLAVTGCGAVMPLPLTFARADDTAAQVDLGRDLFSSVELSSTRAVSCATCHDVERGGADPRGHSIGVSGTRLRRNAPSVINAAANFAQFWDGRAVDLERQALGPVLNPDEMGLSSEAELEGRLAAWAPRFATAFPGAPGVRADLVARALAAYERTLVSRGPLDRFLEGDGAALTPAQRHGYDRFVALRCVFCHTGPALGGTRFERLGRDVPWDDLSDLGREEVTKNPADRHVFKVAPLRNVSRTGPWFHDGSVTTLEDAVRLMGRHQLGVELPAEDLTALVTFLEVL